MHGGTKINMDEGSLQKTLSSDSKILLVVNLYQGMSII
jgi:hypothetical protein